MSRLFAYIEGLSGKQNEIISKHASISNLNTIMIPYTPEIMNIIEEIKKILPTKYIIGNIAHDITKIEYIIKNDYLVVTLIQ